MHVDWDDELFGQVYDQMYATLCARRRQGESAQEIRDELAWRYVGSGLNWVGRGKVWQVTQEATIAAYEAFLAAWDDELSDQESNIRK